MQNAIAQSVGTASKNVSSALPGIAVTFALAAGIQALGTLPQSFGLSPLMLAIAVGLAFNLVIGTPEHCKHGAQFVLKRLLKLAIILFGVKLTLNQLATVNGAALFVIAAVLASTFAFMCWIGKRLSVNSKITSLIAAGTSVCGISAIVASNTVVRASDEDVSYAVATATVFGSLSVLLYPLLAASFQMDPALYAIWVGSSVHEVAQVVAAGFQLGDSAGEFAVIVKLTRILFLIPLVVAIAWMHNADSRAVSGQRRGVMALVRDIPIPLFLLGFVIMVVINTFELVPAAAKSGMTKSSDFLFIAALVALGLETDVGKLREKGLYPLLIGAAGWVFISAVSIALIYLLAAA